MQEIEAKKGAPGFPFWAPSPRQRGKMKTASEFSTRKSAELALALSQLLDVSWEKLSFTKLQLIAVGDFQ